ncbi:MAG: hypothetical protein WCW47_02955 [Candidatus Paceibacterota bacterium]|jgi:hypothetical protein
MDITLDTRPRTFGVTVIILLVMMVASLVPASAQEPTRFVESYNEYVGGHTSPSVTVYLEGPIKGKFGWAVWGWGTNQWTEDGGQWSTEKWAEGLVGLTFAPVDSIQVAFLVGAETNRKPLRFAGNLWISKGRVTLESSHENGGSGYWYRYTGTVRLGSWKLGANSTRFVGTGPYIERSFGPFDLWVAPVKEGKKVGGSAGLRLNF